MNIVYQVRRPYCVFKPRCLTPPAYQRLMGGWDADDGDGECDEVHLQSRMANVSVFTKDMVTPYR